MRKLIAIIILIGLGVTLYFYIGKKLENNDKETGTNGLIEEMIIPQAKDNYDGLLKKVRKLQENPDQLAEFNCMITKLMYTGKQSNEEIALLLKLQREYYSEETLNNNPEDVNLERLLEELEKYKTANYTIMGYKVIGPQFVDAEAGKKPVLIFNVIYYMNVTTKDLGEVYKGYVYEQNAEKLWELKGFGSIEDFSIIN
ncbi:MAG: hypothetical protein CVU84_16320 [Firmicutes bacterium HGW-Firmicutes-1]|jgi:hypothetical protein|nr:MAG: hypothetical protein CVU84_16320 [Firmicutes bacterium HGW-Firmicutes-1]